MNRKLSEISIVVLSHNRKADLQRNLTGLLRIVEREGCELIVVDNASTDGSGEMIRQSLAHKAGTRFIANETNLGVAGGRNAGWRTAGRKFILNIDDDTFVTADAIMAMLSVFCEDASIGIVSPRILHFQTGSRQLDLGTARQSLANFHGACHLLRAELIQRVGLNDELCSFGGEELDYSIRARSAGYNIIYVPDSTVLHNNLTRKGPTGADRRIRWLYNFTRIHYKHFSIHLAARFSLRYFVSHLLSGVRAHGVSFAGPLLAAAIRGVRDGRIAHRPVPARVASFYRDPELRPDYGNVGIWRKLTRRLRAA